MYCAYGIFIFFVLTMLLSLIKTLPVYSTLHAAKAFNENSPQLPRECTPLCVRQCVFSEVTPRLRSLNMSQLTVLTLINQGDAQRERLVFLQTQILGAVCALARTQKYSECDMN